MADFDYKNCLDVKGRFNASKAKKYLREMGISEDTLPFIKEHKRLPSEEDESSEDEPEVLYEAVDFDYSRCVNDKGQFRVGITKAYLKEIGVMAGAVEYIKENIPSPKEMLELMKPSEPEEEKEVEAEPEETVVAEGVKTPPGDHVVEKVVVAALTPKEPDVVEDAVKIAEGIAIGEGAKLVEEMAAEKKVDPARAAVGYVKECWIGSQQCRMCDNMEPEGKPTREMVDGKKVDIEGALDAAPLTPWDLRKETHICKENPWKVALIGTCNKHTLRG